MKRPCVYILASAPNGVLYIGVTSDLQLRITQHERGLIEGFTKRYGVKLLVYYEMFETMPEAIKREKHLKVWQRAWKVRLINFAPSRWPVAVGPGLRRDDGVAIGGANAPTRRHRDDGAEERAGPTTHSVMPAKAGTHDKPAKSGMIAVKIQSAAWGATPQPARKKSKITYPRPLF